jgi:methylglutaconyl-CoA hydratase
METQFETIEYSVSEALVTLTFSRPEIHNAFNDVMIEELLQAVTKVAEREDTRVLVLTGRGKSFCAGADLNWMKRVKDYTYEENLKESLRLAELFYRLYTLSVPTIAKVNGAAIGGGTGFVAVCDLAVASDNSKFSFSEVKLGLVPACISPYVVRKVGEGACREFFLTGERLSAEKAFRYGLVNKVVTPEKLDEAVDALTSQLLSSGPNALATCKELLHKVPKMSLAEAQSYTAQVIASLRVSEEGQEGMVSFLEKRRPRWVRH